jgi:hypothetical protein
MNGGQLFGHALEIAQAVGFVFTTENADAEVLEIFGTSLNGDDGGKRRGCEKGFLEHFDLLLVRTGGMPAIPWVEACHAGKAIAIGCRLLTLSAALQRTGGFRVWPNGWPPGGYRCRGDALGDFACRHPIAP